MMGASEEIRAGRRLAERLGFNWDEVPWATDGDGFTREHFWQAAKLIAMRDAADAAAIGLTPIQLKVHEFVRSLAPASPSVEEIAQHVGMSKSGVHRIILLLEQRGAMRHTRHSSRSWVALPLSGVLATRDASC